MTLRTSLADEDYPPDFTAVGFCGLVIYSSLILRGLVAIAYSFHKGSTRTRKGFFSAITLYASFELPRYAVLARTGAYTSSWSYSCHLVAIPIFFASFSFVCYHWNNVFNPYGQGLASKVFSSTALVVVNVIFATFSITASVFCGLENNLHNFFLSDLFSVYTFADAFKNLFYAVAALHLAFTLRKNAPIFGSAINKMVGVMSLCLLCFCLRCSMLVVKVVVLHDEGSVHLATFGLVWFFLADFIPRAVPAFSFLLLMASGRKQAKADPTAKSPANGTQLGPKNSGSNENEAQGQFRA